MIKGIFFATFDDNQGPKLHHLLPEALPGHPPLLDFKPLAPYIIPPPALCNAPLTLLAPTKRQPSLPKTPPHRILSHPVYIASEYYPRNAFTFNFGIVLEASAEFSSYLPVVKKLATLFRGLEEQGRFLSKDLAASSKKASFTAENKPDDVGVEKGAEEEEVIEDIEEDDNAAVDDGEAPGRGTKSGRQPSSSATRGKSSSSKIYALSEILLEDLNNYGETQIPLDAATTLNLKLFPTYPPPPPLHAWHVPLATVSLATLLPENASSYFKEGSPSSGGDLTMTRILPHIDGVNSVSRIAQLADADFKLVRKAIRHLLYYGCCILLDIFAFGAIYAPTSTIAAFVDDAGMQEECRAYVVLPLAFAPTATTAAAGDVKKKEPAVAEVERDQSRNRDHPTITGTQLSELYLSLRQGLSVKSWCLEHAEVLSALDIRRFITFGVIKGFLYRVHKYAILTSKGGAVGKGKGRRKGTGGRGVNAMNTTAADGTGAGGGTDETGDEGKEGHAGAGAGEDKLLDRFLDGTHCFDEICTELAISERELLARLKERGGDVQIICR